MGFFLALAYVFLTFWSSFPSFHGHASIETGKELSWQEDKRGAAHSADCSLCQWHAAAQSLVASPVYSIGFETRPTVFTWPPRPGAAPSGLLERFSPRGPPLTLA